MINSGIYKITNTINQKIYVGKTKNFDKRWRQYKYDFNKRRNKSINSYLMNAMIKYGFYNFEFSILEFCEINLCAEKELYWIDFYDSCNHEKGYNLRRDSSTGMITHETTSVKISNRLKSEWSSGIRDDHSEKLSKNWSTRSKTEQSKLLTNILTKYCYEIIDEHGNSNVVVYKQLCNLGLKNVIASFHKKNTSVVKFKGYIIRRVDFNESKA